MMSIKRKIINHTIKTLCLVLLVFPLIGHAAPVQVTHQNLTLNAEYIDGDKQNPIYVILHGTWMHHTMDLPSTLQTLLSEEGQASLNISLGLGIDNRSTFISCKIPMVAAHQHAEAELDVWMTWLKQQGWKRFVLIGHSRGGTQITSYANGHKKDGIEKLVLIAPMSWEKSFIEEAYETEFEIPLDTQLARFKSAKDPKSTQLKAPTLYCGNANVSAEAFLSYYTDQPQKHTPTLLKHTTLPTDIYLGTGDRHSRRLAGYLDDLTQRPNIRVTWIEGSDHFFRDLYADEIIEGLQHDQ